MSPDKNSPPERPSSSGGGGTTNLQLILLLNAGFAMAAFAGGLMVNSVAILTHAILSLGDAISLGFSRRIATPSEKETSKGASKRQISHPLLMMGALAASVILIAGVGALLMTAIPRLWGEPSSPRLAGMIGLAVAGLLMNGFVLSRLRAGRSPQESMISRHLLEGGLGWMAILAVGILLAFKEAPVLDPVLAILLALGALANALRGLKRLGLAFLQTAPEGFSFRRVEERLRGVAGVLAIHDAHLWSLDGERRVLTVRAVVDPATSKEKAASLKRRLKEIARKDAGASQATVEIEFGENDGAPEPNKEEPKAKPRDEEKKKAPAEVKEKAPEEVKSKALVGNQGDGAKSKFRAWRTKAMPRQAEL